MSGSSGGEDLGINSPLPPTSEDNSFLGQSPTEQESLLGYSPTELQLGEQRKRNLSSVISQLSERWDLRVDSPEKSDTNAAGGGSSRASRALRRGSLDLLQTPKNGSGNSSLRSRSCETVSPVKVHLRRLSQQIGELTSPGKAIVNECDIDSFEMEAVTSTKENDDGDDTESSPKDEKPIEGNQEAVLEESQREEKGEKGGESETDETGDSNINDVSIDEDSQILEKMLEVVPPTEETKDKMNEDKELEESSKTDESPAARETRRTRTSAKGTRARSSQRTDDSEQSPSVGARETRTRSSALSEELTSNTPPTQREMRTRAAASAQEESVVRETRARSRAVAEENQPPARSTRSNRDSTPDNSSSRRAESASKRSSLGGTSGGVNRPKRGSLAGVSTLSWQDGSGVADMKLTRRQAVVELNNSSCRDSESTPDRRASRSRHHEERSAATPTTESDEPSTPCSTTSVKTSTRTSVLDTPGSERSERRSTRSSEAAVVQPEVSSAKIAKLSEPLTETRSSTPMRETRRTAEADTKRTSTEEGDENMSLGRRLRSLRSDQSDSEGGVCGRSSARKHELTPSTSRSPHKKFKTDESKKGDGARRKEIVNKDGVVISLKRKKKKLAEKGKAYHEADVIRRVQELKAQGLWPDKKMPKSLTEPKNKVHWDFVLEEMTWLSDVVQKELKIKKANAKKCAAMVQKYFKDKELASIRAEKMREANLRKIAANMAREVRVFWGNAQKLFEWRVKQKLEKKRKEALDQHLQFIVDKTEKYSTLLAESLAENASGQVSRAESVCSGDTDSVAPGGGGDDGEYDPDSASSDDEETIEKEEVQAKGDSSEAGCDEELADLEAGAEVPIEELLKKFYPDQWQKMNGDEGKDDTTTGVKIEDGQTKVKTENTGVDEFKKDPDSEPAKENSSEEPAKEKSSEEPAKEMSSEEPAKEKSSEEPAKEKSSTESAEEKSSEEPAKTISYDSSSTLITTGRRRRKPIDFAEVERKIKEEDNSKLFGTDVVKKESSEGSDDIEKDDDTKTDLKELVQGSIGDSAGGQPVDGGDGSSGGGEDKLEEYANMAAKFQPTGNTLETTTVKTKVPSLLKHTLREYQHIGLDWLVSLYERGLNGILADEMGLGKTIQTIALLAHLAVDRSNWGPHLIVVPTSVMLNWEMEIKKWCPGFKVLVYYGSQKERRMKRVGWTKQNAFHICITSYKLVIQDHSSFRRFKWQYFILDEAQHIKNFKSQRWQLLLNFASVGRLLLTGTPLQNNLMELWSLMHFLMPHVFESHRDFKEWFSNPLTGMVEGNSEYNDNLIKRLHKVLRPFILRRLKSEVEKQLPKKYEHLVKCPLSKRQRYLYDDFMSRAKTKETLATGNLLSVINVLMQLRKCCNHPNLFEPRPTLSPFVMEMVDLKLPKLVQGCTDYKVDSEIDLRTTDLHLLHHETRVDPYTVFRASCLATPIHRMTNPVEDATLAKFSCPEDKMFMEIRSQNPSLPKHDFEHHSPVLALTLTGLGYVIPAKKLSNRDYWLWKPGHVLKTPSGYFQIARVPALDFSATAQVDNETDAHIWSPPRKIQKLDSNIKIQDPNVKEESRTTDTDSSNVDQEPRRKLPRFETKKSMRGIFSLGLFASEKLTLAAKSPNKAKKRRLEAKARETELICPAYNAKNENYTRARRERNFRLNKRRCEMMPLYGSDLVGSIEQMSLVPSQLLTNRLEQLTCNKFPVLPKAKKKSVARLGQEEITCYTQNRLLQTVDSAFKRIEPLFDRFLINVPKAWVTNKHTIEIIDRHSNESGVDTREFPGDRLLTRFQVHMPDTRLIQYDCGKLQILSVLLRRLHTEGHRALIFTQMTKMLDVLESFLNYHGYVYMRLDGATKVETRQALMERFNNNSKYFIFILSTRSGGVGINLTGADTVIFYDSDWNPTMDAQAQDRCHRIGQTRDVHIYRLVSERTVEENILKKANQKRLLGDLAIEGGNFTTAFFKKQTIHDLFEENANATSEDITTTTSVVSTTGSEENISDGATTAPKKSIGAFESALATAEDDTDRQATKNAKAEENVDEQDFNEQTEEDQFNAVLAELSKVEVYALRHVENMEEDWVQGQLAAAQAEIQARKEEFDAEKLDELTQEIREEMGDVSSEGGEEEEESNDDADSDDSSDEEREDEYSPSESGSDDEATIDKDEKEVDDKDNGNELNMLANESEIPIEELIKQYYPADYEKMDLGHEEVIQSILNEDDSSMAENDSSLDDSMQQFDQTGLDTTDAAIAEAMNEVIDNEEFHVEVTQQVMAEAGFVSHDATGVLQDINNDQEAMVQVAEAAGDNDGHIVNGNAHVEILDNSIANETYDSNMINELLDSYSSAEADKSAEGSSSILEVVDESFANTESVSNDDIGRNISAENSTNACETTINETTLDVTNDAVENFAEKLGEESVFTDNDGEAKLIPEGSSRSSTNISHEITTNTNEESGSILVDETVATVNEEKSESKEEIVEKLVEDTFDCESKTTNENTAEKTEEEGNNSSANTSLDSLNLELSES